MNAISIEHKGEHARHDAEAETAVRSAVRASAGRLFAEFLDKLPAALERAAGQAINPVEARGYQEIGRRLRSDAETWRDAFVEQVDVRLHKGVVAEAADAGVGASADSISMAKSLVLAETKYFKTIAEIDARLNQMNLMFGVSAYGKALAPTGLHDALEQTAQLIHWPENCRRALYEAFQQISFNQLEQIYAGLVLSLKQIGIEAGQRLSQREQQATIPARAAEEDARARAPKSLEERLRPPEDCRAVDSQTERMLKEMALHSEGDGYTDGLLAADLLALMDERPLPGVQEDQSWITLQRMSLAGHFLNGVSADPMVPEDMRGEHESLRMPLVKSAIADSSIFTAETHPLRSIIDELMMRSATLKLSEDPETRRMTELLEQVLEHFDLAADFVRESMATAKPLEETQIQRFFELQRRQAEQRREFVISEARRMVSGELERSTFGRDVPPRGMQFFDKLWGPLLTRRLLKHGAAHALWKEGTDQADRLIDLIEDRDPDSPAGAEWEELVASMADALVGAGMPAEQRPKVLQLLEAARKSPRAFL